MHSYKHLLETICLYVYIQHMALNNMCMYVCVIFMLLYDIIILLQVLVVSEMPRTKLELQRAALDGG